MKLCRYDDDLLGVVIGDAVHDVTPLRDEMLAGISYAMKGDPIIAGLPQWRDALETAAASAPGRPVSGVRLLSPVGRPSKLVAAPVNYLAHIAESQADRGISVIQRSTNIREAGMFLKSASALVGPSEGVAIRFLDRRNDHEVEIALIIGKEGSDIARGDAFDYIAGYAIGLDMTLRGSEDRSFRKSIDGYAVLGPWMVTAEEIAEPADIAFSIAVNGEVRQDANTRDLVLDIPDLIEFASSFYTLYPGDVIYTGSPEGVGPVHPGDVMRAECAAIGAMEIAVRAHEPGRS